MDQQTFFPVDLEDLRVITVVTVHKQRSARCTSDRTGSSMTACMSAVPQLLALACTCLPADGYSTSRTCEVSMSNAAGINFRGMVYLVDEATKPKKVAQGTQAAPTA